MKTRPPQSALTRSTEGRWGSSGALGQFQPTPPMLDRPGGHSAAQTDGECFPRSGPNPGSTMPRPPTLQTKLKKQDVTKLKSRTFSSITIQADPSCFTAPKPRQSQF